MNQQTLSALRADLLGVLDGKRISEDPEVGLTHAADWSDTPGVRPDLVIFPDTPEQVARVLAILQRHGCRTVVQGGLTGLAGAATTQPGEVALSLHRLNRIEAFDEIGGTVTVQAGLPLEELQNRVEEKGWLFPLDLSSRGSCQVGGNAATNAGGNRVIRYGTMRERVLGLEVALPDGQLLTMLNRVTKNTTGIDLKHLFIGAEGTLGVITRLVLKLSPLPAATQTALCAVDSFEQAAALLKRLRRGLPGLSAFELMWRDFMDMARELTGARPPFDQDWPLCVLVETQGEDDAADRAALEKVLFGALEEGTIADAVVAQSLAHGESLWQGREAIGEMLSHLKPHAAFDVGVPMDAMAGLVAAVREALNRAFPDRHHLFFGHLGDGNLHVLSGAYPDPADLHRVEEIVYRLVAEAGGCISAEHGIGMVKREFLGLSRGPAELELMRKLKAVLDPSGVLNHGRVFDC